MLPPRRVLLVALVAVAAALPAALGAQSSRRTGASRKSGSSASNASSVASTVAAAPSAVAATVGASAGGATGIIATGSTTVGTTSAGATASVPAGAVAPTVATLTRTWNACGGPTPTSLVCASIEVEVTGTSTVVRVRNRSGDPALAHDGAASAGQWVLTTIGFDGVAAAAGTFTTGAEPSSGPWWQPTPSSVAPRSWHQFDDEQYGGGVNLDFGIDNGNGISGGIASSCATLRGLPGGSNHLWMTPVDGCDAYAIADRSANDGWFESRFITAQSWDPRDESVSAFFKGQNGPGGASYECLVGGDHPRGGCGDDQFVDAGGPPPGAVVPEPRTLLLVGTGLAGLLAPAVRRRISQRRFR